MPTVKPRVNVVLEPHLFELIRRIGEHQGKSASKVLREIIAPTEPVLKQIADALDQVAALDGVDRRDAAIKASRAMLEASKTSMSDLENQMTIFDVEGVSETAEADPLDRTADGLENAPATPVSNTGVTCSASHGKRRVKS